MLKFIKIWGHLENDYQQHIKHIANKSSSFVGNIQRRKNLVHRQRQKNAGGNSRLQSKKLYY